MKIEGPKLQTNLLATPDFSASTLPSGGLSATHPGSPGGGGTKTCDPITCSDRTSALLRGISVVLQEHDAPGNLVNSFIQQIHRYLDDATNELVWVKRCKYLLALPLSKYLRCEAPSVPDRAFSPSGIVRRWMKNRLNSFSRKNTHLWYSWFQCKRCTLVCSDDFIDQTYREHLESLTKEDPGDPFAIDAAFSNPTFFRVLERVRDDVEKDLLTAGVNRYIDISCTTPSTSACFNTSRLEGGQVLALRRACADLDGWCPKNGLTEAIHFTSFSDELYRMDWFPCIMGSDLQVVEIRQPSGFDDWVELIDIFKKMCPDDRLGAQIQGVLEPLKVRVISKGESIPYYFHKGLQRALHDSIRVMPCFRLVGRPFCPTDVMDLKEVAVPGSLWFSVDYSAATDGLSWRFASTILRFLLARFPKKDLDWALRVLGPHDLYYPTREKKGSYVFGGTQTNGQLMGSILSFPILCLANLATYLLTMSDIQAGWEDEKRLRGVLVNGDDMVYAAPREKWDRHVKVARDLGLQMSVGKAYQHRTYLNINSISVHYSLDIPGTPDQIGYLNTGLLFRSDVQKKKGSDSLASFSGTIASINPLLDGCLTEKGKCRILAKYLDLHKREILQESSLTVNIGRSSNRVTRNLFLPCSLGGLGVDPPKGFRYRIKPFDRVLARSFLQEGIRYSLGRPCPAPELEAVKAIQPVPWMKVECGGSVEHHIGDVHKKIPKGFRQGLIPIGRTITLEPGLPISLRESRVTLEGPMRAKNAMESKELKHPKSVQEFLGGLVDDADRGNIWGPLTSASTWGGCPPSWD